jgi:hypothetical protein
VSGFILEPAKIIVAPIMIFNAKANGIRGFEDKEEEDGEELARDKRFMAISGDHEPIMSPPL